MVTFKEVDFFNNSPVTTILLTVGKSPLPVYASAHYLLHSFKNDSGFPPLYFIATESQLPLCESLTSILKERVSPNLDVKTLTLNDDARYQVKILKANLREGLNEVLENARKAGIDEHHFHVNYTGGTKVLCVHTVSEIESFTFDTNQQEASEFTSSYLDSKSHKITCSSNKFREYISSPDLRLSVHLNLIEILGLHGYKPEGAFDDEPESVKPFSPELDFIAPFVDSIRQGKRMSDYIKIYYESDYKYELRPGKFRWENYIQQCLNTICSFIRTKNYFVSDHCEEKYLEKCIQFSEGLLKQSYNSCSDDLWDKIPVKGTNLNHGTLSDALEKSIKIFRVLRDMNENRQKAYLSDISKNEKQALINLEGFIGFFDSKWLESYTGYQFYSLSKANSSLNKGQIFKAADIYQPTSQSVTVLNPYDHATDGIKDDNTCEIDGFFIHGYQLFCVSCYNPNKWKRDKVKTKAFEILHWAKL